MLVYHYPLLQEVNKLTQLC